MIVKKNFDCDYKIIKYNYNCEKNSKKINKRKILICLINFIFILKENRKLFLLKNFFF